MQLREARRGRNAGNRFWGCSGYPNCRATLELGGEAAGASAAEPGAPQRRVGWRDGTCEREGWICRYRTAGASLRASEGLLPAALQRSLCWIARIDPGEPLPLNEPQLTVLEVFRKIIQRGSAPPIDPRSERHLLTCGGWGPRVRPAPLPGDLGVRLRPDLAASDVVALLPAQADDCTLDASLAYDSDEERSFHREWLAKNLGPTAPRWFVPQAPLDTLLEARGVESQGARRVDFLAVAPWLESFVVEIDGQQHDAASTTDDERDGQLRRAGFDVIRVPIAELRAGHGPQLRQLQARWTPAPATSSDEAVALLDRAASVHRFVLALDEAIRAGHLREAPWALEVVSSTAVPVESLVPYFDLLFALDRLWGAQLVPERISVLVDGQWSELVREAERYALARQPEPIQFGARACIRLETHLAPTDSLERLDDRPAVVVRGAHLPVELLEAPPGGARRLPPEMRSDEHGLLLRTVLQAVFAKEDFREGQLDALTEILAGRDCVVLLPTGAGKSLIYQLAGLVLPGSTLIVDPLVALMEDQLEGLREYGIDRATLLSSHQTQLGLRGLRIQEIASGESLFTFVAPERLQQKEFRDALQAQAQVNPINLVVIDEAHCVSEWGHDFRTSYLNLGRVLREYGQDIRKRPPPLLALTGTASRAVLRDVLIELEINRSERSLVRPRSFDRKELRFQIVHTTPERCEGALEGMLRTVPARFNMGVADLLAPRGDNTYSGIVFCPHVNGSHGVERVARRIQSAFGHLPALYAGSAPRGMQAGWEQAKRRAAADFKENRAPLLVSTKAFGMGIDKPNIRYVIHYGIPSSIEAYYQEVGRAGRDRRRAECGLVAIDFDERRSRRLLDDTESLEITRSHRGLVQRTDEDDVARQLYFHLRSFRGVEAELGLLESVLNEIGELGSARSVEIPMGDDDEVRERAIHRLVVLGAIHDYLVNWGGRRFSLRLQEASPSTVLERLFNYVRRNQPGRVEAIRDRIGTGQGMQLREAILAAARELIEFIYDTVERSRRRSLREMWLAAQDSLDDPNTTFRQRILDYLTQGDIAPALEALVDRERFAASDWLELVAGVHDPEDARELRGNAARLLSSYPDHPGLLIARAMSEAIDPKGDLRELSSNLRMALDSATRRYGTDEREIAALLDSIATLCTEHRPAALTAILAAAERMGLSFPFLDRLLATALSDSPSDVGVRILALSRQLDAVERSLNRILERRTGAHHG